MTPCGPNLICRVPVVCLSVTDAGFVLWCVCVRDRQTDRQTKTAANTAASQFKSNLYNYTPRLCFLNKLFSPSLGFL